MSLIRIDQWLSLNGFANSRTHASVLIDQRQILIFNPTTQTWEIVTKSSLKVNTLTLLEHIKINPGPGKRYVSRGGLKLEGAFKHLNFNVKNLRVLDIGISTGGFTDCCLQQEAQYVVGLDVGHNQLSPQLNKYKNFIHFEGINAKNLPEYKYSISELQIPFDLIIGDLSFISTTAVLPHLTDFLNKEGHIIFLVKPQFELDSQALNKNGVVKDPHSYDSVKSKIYCSCEVNHLHVEDYFNSSIEGKDGNKEFFLFAKPKF